MIKTESIKERRHAISNACIAATFTLIYQALHDMYGFSRGRFHVMNIASDEYSDKICVGEVTYNKIRDSIIDTGVNEQFILDFSHCLEKALGISGKIEREAADKAIEYTYILMFYALHDKFKFGKNRMQSVQQKIKWYGWCILDHYSTIIEYMKCMNIECGQKYEVLDEWESKFGNLNIYG
jgi:hypothetical protein